MLARYRYRVELGHVGVWWSGNWASDASQLADLLGELQSLGYQTIWRSGGFEGGLSREFERLLAANSQITVASGIHSIWTTPAEETAAGAAYLEDTYAGRFVLGLGVSHAQVVEPGGQRYDHPYDRMVGYLDDLDRAAEPVPKDHVVLAALGPRMLALAARRTAGAHPYLVPPEHTEQARATLGPDALLAPEVAVALESDAGLARQMARSYVEPYLGLPNYAQNLRRLGYGEDDISGGASDRLVDAVVAWGDEEAVGSRLRDHLDAGASHVCIQVLNGGYHSFPLAEYRRLAEASPVN